MNRTSCNHRRGSAYIVVLMGAMLLTVIGLASMQFARVQTRMSNGTEDFTKASIHGQSVLDIALLRLADDPNWRTTHTNDTWTTDEIVDELTFSYKLVDEIDGNLVNNSIDPVRVYAKATVGIAVRFYSVLLSPQTGVGPIELRSFTGTAGTTQDDVTAAKWWAQYFKPESPLPAEATGWKVTSVELYVAKGDADKITDIRLYEPLPSNMPSSNIIDAVAVNSNSLSTGFAWVEFFFAGHSNLDPTEGLCLALTTTANGVSMRLEYQGAGVLESDSGFITGNPSWNSYVTDKAILYKVHGTWTDGPGMSVVTGSRRKEVN